ncbi:hypothetical protein DL771_011541 [Monosporascus sp. 5C6A]|nr:hypothetical protein DL771_011541 [Monosporascus sp. 5C6A]
MPAIGAPCTDHIMDVALQLRITTGTLSLATPTLILSSSPAPTTIVLFPALLYFQFYIIPPLHGEGQVRPPGPAVLQLSAVRDQLRLPARSGQGIKRPRPGVAPQLSERLSRLESVIKKFGAAAQVNHLAQETSHAREASETHSFDQDFSRLKVDESKSYYVNNALWVTLSNEVEELRDLLFEPASEDAGYEPLGLNAAMFGYRAIASSLHHFHPSLPQAVALLAAFTDNVASLVRISHMPTLTRVYWDAIASLDSLDKYIFSTLDETREAALERYRFAVEQALARDNLLNTQNITMLQAAVPPLSALPNEDDSRAVWSG